MLLIAELFTWTMVFVMSVTEGTNGVIEEVPDVCVTACRLLTKLFFDEKLNVDGNTEPAIVKSALKLMNIGADAPTLL